jgi:O-antigen/teichoic acid export membrane protein
MFSSVARNFSIMTAATIIVAAISFLFITFVARQFGPLLLGKYILITVYVQVTSVLVNAGIFPIALRELARHRDDASDLFDDILSLRLVLGVVGYLALMLVTWSSEAPEYLALIGVAGLTLLVEPFIGSYRIYYTAQERMKIPSAYSIVIAGFSALAGSVLLIAGFGLLALIVSDFVVSLVVCIIWTAHFRTSVLRFQFRMRFVAWRRLLLLIIPFAPIHISSQINSVLNIFLLGRINGPLPIEQSVGYYSPAYSITNTIIKLVMGMRRALIPHVTVKLSQGYSLTQEIDTTLKVVIVVFCLPLVLITTYMSPEIISFIFGGQYAPSASVLMMLGWAGALQIAAFVPESFLFSNPEHNMQEYIAGPATSVLINAVLCILLIQEHGILGAAVAAIAARFVYFLFIAQYYRRQSPGQALGLHSLRDVSVLFVSSFCIWYFAFAWIENPWFAFTMAGVVTLPLIAAYLLYLRSQLLVQVAG